MARRSNIHAEWGRARSARQRRRAELEFEDWEISQFLAGPEEGINGSNGRIPVRFGVNRLADHWEAEALSDDDGGREVIQAAAEELLLFPLDTATAVAAPAPAAAPFETPPTRAVYDIRPLAVAMRRRANQEQEDSSAEPDALSWRGIARGFAMGLGAAAAVFAIILIMRG
jgi:hypothetical protein